MASSNIKTPPTLDQHKDYESWEKSFKLWQLVTDLKPEKQGPALALALTGKARDVALELSVDDMSKDDGVSKIMQKLRAVYKKDSVDSAYEAFEKFIYFKRPDEMQIAAFITEFERKLNKAKSHGCILSENILAFLLLDQANLADTNKKLVRATLEKLEYEGMKSKLMKIFGNDRRDSGDDGVKVKLENLNLAEGEDVYYGRFVPRGSQAQGYQNRFQRPSFKRYEEHRPNAGNYYQNKDRNKYYADYQDRNKNRPRCKFCQSVYHQFNECPDRLYFSENFDEEEPDHDVVLYQSGLLTGSEFEVFVAQASNSAILDSGASATVAGENWFNDYYEGLSEEQQKSVEFSEGKSYFKFGSGQKFKSKFKAIIPACIGRKNVRISTDIVETSIPLLLSKRAMKSASTSINFVTDEVEMLGQSLKVKVTKCGHYAIPINKSDEIMRDLKKNENTKITLLARDCEDKVKIARKLHAQFGHPPKEKLLLLIKRAGMGSDTRLLDEIEKVYENCDVCKVFKQPSPRPCVGLPHAMGFNETVAMDLKFFKGHIILHMIDHLTRFSAGYICKSKAPKEILRGVFQCWIAIFGSPQKFLTDNGGEFGNKEFLEMAEQMNVRVLTTAAMSPWSNGLVERHNATLSETLYRIMENKDIDIETALAWAISAKNSLTNVHGFSPAQLALGHNPQIPGSLTNKPPALEEPTQEIVRKHLNAMKSAREAFVKAESSERVQRALRKNTRTHNNVKYITGDIVYYKRNDDRRWRGPGTVIGSESSNILIKHGPNYVRVHSCRVMPLREAELSKEVKIDESSKEDPEQPRAPSNSTVEQIIPVVKTNWQQPLEIDSSESKSTIENEPEVTPSCDEAREQFTDENHAEGSEEMESEDFEDATEESMTDPSDKGLSEVSRDGSKLRKGLCVEFTKDSGEIACGTVLRRSGKATGKYRDFWAVMNNNTGQIEEYDVKNDWKSWKEKPLELSFNENQEINEIHSVSDSEDKYQKQKVAEAKEIEIKKWFEEKVIEEVKDEGQPKISTVWVITKNEATGVCKTKARLVARGYEEECKERADSPTCIKDNLRVMLTVAASKNWTIHSLDVKAAFLQGKPIERCLYLQPPKEVRKQGIIWKLNKVVYGLADASRSWYLKVLEVLESLGMRKFKLDGAMFVRDRCGLDGVIIIHVDDLLFFGTSDFLDNVMKRFKELFKISREESEVFKYIGIKLTQRKDLIILDQNEYLSSINSDVLDRDKLADKDRFVEGEEITLFRRSVGQLGWLSTVTKPEASFMHCLLGTIQAKPQVKDFILFKKIVTELKTAGSKIILPRLDLDTVSVTVFSDASFGTLTGGASQLGYVIFVGDNSGKLAPVSWTSKKCNRVARSTLTAETLAAVEALDGAFLIKTILEETLSRKLPAISLHVDSKSLFEATKTTNVIADKRLMIDMAALRELIERNQVEINWIPNERQLADVLTKAGANKRKLTDVLSVGRLE